MPGRRMGAMVGQRNEELANQEWGVPCQVEGAIWSARGLDREFTGGWPNNGTVHETEQATTNRHHQYP